jgi:hypothetical protein
MAEQNVNYQPETCCSCGGRFAADCSACGGAGSVLVAQPARKCASCGGRGLSCDACGGTGWAHVLKQRKTSPYESYVQLFGNDEIEAPEGIDCDCALPATIRMVPLQRDVLGNVLYQCPRCRRKIRWTPDGLSDD